MWEARHGFPQPDRSDGGHRRYQPEEVDRVQRVAAERQAGLALPLAIRRVRDQEPLEDVSLFAELRRLHPELTPRTLTKRAMIGLSFAIEDETMARAERPILCGAFQRQRFYRQVQHRWQELARTAFASFVFADFTRVRRPATSPMEVPLASGSPMMREWLLVSWDQRLAVCLVGWELPEQRQPADSGRRFEAVWTLETDLVRRAAHLCVGRVAGLAPALAATARERIDSLTGPGAAEQLRAAAALTTRMAEHLA
jgi:DICT domain-containing protein